MAHDSSALDRRTLFKATLGAATVAVVGTDMVAAGAASAAPAVPGAATAADPFGFVVGCDEWGARPPSSTIQLSGNVTNKIIVHHMAFPNSTDYSLDHAKQLARDCQNLHMDTNGWADTGQHFTVSRGGYVMEGRHRSLETLEGGQQQVVAAHCPGENGNAIGIENEGTYITETPPRALIDALTKLCATVCTQYGLHAYDIFGHWDFRDTDCPGIAFYREFPMLRRRVQAALGESASAAPARRWPDIWRFVGGPVVRLGQYLLNSRGYQLATDGGFGAATLAAVQDWQAKQGLAVDPDGTFTTATWETLVAPVYRDGSGPAVAGLQFLLNHKGYALSETGAYDDATQTAVKQLQRLHGLRPTGKVDTTTWCAVAGGTVREAL
ncbi:peptidoglycan recognition protein family protein [Actinocatenispora rupis]|nr:N-acetylmuramoyl-L-alanine amidase [Actinocatenispora rupis]